MKKTHDISRPQLALKTFATPIDRNMPTATWPTMENLQHQLTVTKPQRTLFRRSKAKPSLRPWNMTSEHYVPQRQRVVRKRFGSSFFIWSPNPLRTRVWDQVSEGQMQIFTYMLAVKYSSTTIWFWVFRKCFSIHRPPSTPSETTYDNLAGMIYDFQCAEGLTPPPPPPPFTADSHHIGFIIYCVLKGWPPPSIRQIPNY